jgi:hypothetical protein
VLAEYVRHYNEARPHRGLQLAQPIPHPVTTIDGEIARRGILGGSSMSTTGLPDHAPLRATSTAPRRLYKREVRSRSASHPPIFGTPYLLQTSPATAVGLVFGPFRLITTAIDRTVPWTNDHPMRQPPLPI